MIIETSQLKEKLEDEIMKINKEKIPMSKDEVRCEIQRKGQIVSDLWRVERIEELFKKYFGG